MAVEVPRVMGEPRDLQIDQADDDLRRLTLRADDQRPAHRHALEEIHRLAVFMAPPVVTRPAACSRSCSALIARLRAASDRRSRSGPKPAKILASATVATVGRYRRHARARARANGVNEVLWRLWRSRRNPRFARLKHLRTPSRWCLGVDGVGRRLVSRAGRSRGRAICRSRVPASDR